MAAQAARLSLRMQKELKLLIADPPHGACFPRLSSDSDHVSLSSIHAQMKGPEGSVYEDGVFEVEIRIPERYPFQPPIVTVSTPIYHPNIDTGGRICLDILNLPPKGAWQPSLNISTVMMSIGLLLSEPNPDDGLMCEASREYKYNRQAFDQKARSMTEKYAHPGASGDSGASGSQYNSMSSIMKTKPTEPIGKLTVESSRPSPELVDSGASNSHHLLVSGLKNHIAEGSDLARNNLKSNRRKLALESPKSRKSNEDKKGNVDSDCPKKDIGLCQENSSVVDDSVNLKLKKMRWTLPKHQLGSSERSDVTESKILAKPRLLSSETDALAYLDRRHLNPLPQKKIADSIENASLGTIRENVSLGGKKLSLGLKGLSGRTKNKENVEPILKSQSSLMRTLSYPSNSISGKHENARVEKSDSDQDRNETVDNRIGEQEEEEEESIMPETVIVLDSEDSEEEDKSVSLRSKPRLAREPLGKWKLRA